jgi:hypothetical protein
MQEQLYKYLKRRSSKVEQISAEILLYEKAHDHWKEIIPLVSETDEIGIEIEVEKVESMQAINYGVWVNHADGSLRNNGVEFVSLPIKGKRIHYALNQFFDALGKNYHFSPRTSIHIHVNVLDLLPKQIGALTMTYVPFERILYRFVGGSRDKSNFAVPVSDTDFSSFIKLFTADEWALFGSLESRRYLGLNIDAVRKYGTLEFRHLGGTDDKTRIVRWINLIFKLKQFVEKNSFDEIKARIDKLNTDSQYTSFFNDVFGDVGWYLDQSNLKEDMEQGVSIVKRLTIPNDFWNEIKGGFSTKSLWYTRALEKARVPNFLSLDATPPRRQAGVPRYAPPQAAIPEWRRVEIERQQAQPVPPAPNMNEELHRAVERVRGERARGRRGLFGERIGTTPPHAVEPIPVEIPPHGTLDNWLTGNGGFPVQNVTINFDNEDDYS